MEMIKKIIKYSFYTFLISLCILSGFVFIPRTYYVPQLEKREGIKYWDLSTGSKIAYTLIPYKGDKKAYPIIFLQGGPGGCITKRIVQLFTPLSELGYDIYLYDQIGSGYSNRLANIKEYTANRHKKDLEEIVKKIGSEKVIIIGQSWGAVLATLYIADNPDEVDKFILTSPGPIFPVREELEYVEPPDSIKLKDPIITMEEADARTNNIRNRVTFILARNFGIKLTSDKEADDFQTQSNFELSKCTVCKESNAIKPKGGSGYYVSVMTVNSLSDIKDPRPQLKNSKIPILIVKGQCDYMRWGYATEYLDVFSNHQFVFIPNAGHSIPAEQPELFIKALNDFLE